MNASDTFTVQCHICTQPITLPQPHTGSQKLNQMLVSMATTSMAHDACIKTKRSMAQAAEQASKLEQRAKDWKILCPPLYQDSDKWIEGKPKKINNWATEEAHKWVYGERGLILHGKKSGTGKTTNAWCIIKREFIAGKFCCAMSHTEFSTQATLAARDNTYQHKRWRGIVEQCDLLFVDDLGKGRFKTVDGTGKAGEELLFDVLDFRIANKLPTIFTCNSDGEGLKASMSEERAEPFVRRLREFCTAVNFDKGITK